MEEQLKDLFYGKKVGLLGKKRFIDKAFAEKAGTKKEIAQWVAKQEIVQRAKKVRKTVKGLRIIAPPYSYQLDIMHFPSYAQKNHGYKMILLLIEITSKKAFGYPMKTKTMAEIIENYTQFLTDAEHVKQVESDDEFNKVEFKELNDKMKIDLRTDVAKDLHITSGDKLGIIDRFTHTLREMITNQMNTENTVIWADHLNGIIDLYNNAKHSATGQTPNDIFTRPNIMWHIYMKGIEHNRNMKQPNDDLLANTKIRIVNEKQKFDKDAPRFSKEIYTILKKVKNKYIILDAEGKEVKRTFKPNEVSKVTEIQKFEKEDRPDEIKIAKKVATVTRRLRKEGLDENIKIVEGPRVIPKKQPIPKPIPKPKKVMNKKPKEEPLLGIPKKIHSDMMYKGVKAFEVEWVGIKEHTWEPARNIKHTKVYKDYIKKQKG